jgi:hypothetical protein
MTRILRCLLIAPWAMTVACGGTTAASTSDAADASTTDAASRDSAAGDASGSDGSRAPVHHRANDSACSGPSPGGDCALAGAGACKADSDCTAGTNGRCVESGGGAIFCSCSYDTCTHDTDCPTGKLCACHGSTYFTGGNTCTDGNCRIDADCGVGGYCSPSRGGCGGLTGYYCHAGSDTCIDDADCPSSGSPMICAYSSTSKHWECTALLLCP